MIQETYICSQCGNEVVIEQTVYDKYDLDNMCPNCYSQNNQEKR